MRSCKYCGCENTRYKEISGFGINYICEECYEIIQEEMR